MAKDVEKKYLPLYERWCKQNRLPMPGLCASLQNDKLLDMFSPVKFNEADWYWGYSGNKKYWASEVDGIDVSLGFTPLRKTILLFMAAMNDEL